MNSALKAARAVVVSHTRKAEYAADLQRFRELAGTDSRFEMGDLVKRPILDDKNTALPFDPHYFFHPAWATRVLAERRPAKHVDISSILHFAAAVSAFIPTEYYEFQPPDLGLPDLPTRHVELTNLPFADGSLESLSCMHVVEHIGLGRYGDPIDPLGDLSAALELQRVVAPGGLLLFVAPIAAEARIEFNAHRVYTFEMVLEMFPEMKLSEFALIPDPEPGGRSRLIRNADPSQCAAQHYACGCFHLTKACLSAP
jgi:hypothetical protein